MSALHRKGRAIHLGAAFKLYVRGNRYRIVSPQPFNLSTTQTSPAFINGALSGNILIDTSQVATDTIDYVATDTWGNTSTSTRTAIVQSGL